MAFKTLPTRARQDPFAFRDLNDLFDNMRATDYFALQEHTNEGKHNALEVSRAVATVVWGGASYTLEGNTSSISAVSRSSAGVTTLTLDATKFSTPMAVRVWPMGNDAEAVPLMATYTVNSASSITVRVWKLASLAGNTWALTDEHYCIAVHSVPIAPGSGLTALTNAQRGDTLGGASSSRWNKYVGNAATAYSRLLLEHTSAGVHHAREIAYGFGVVQWTGAAYSLADNAHVSSVAKQSLGVCRLNLPAGYTTPFQVFVQPDYNRNAGNAYDVTMAFAPRSQITSSKIDVYAYTYSSSTNTWARADIGFSASIHHTPS